VGAVEQEKGMLGAILSHATRIRTEGSEIVVEFPADGETWLRHADRDDYRDILTRCAEEVCGPGTGVKVLLATAPATETGNGDRDVPAGRKRSNGGGSGSYRQLLSQARSEPGVDRLLREFGAQVVDIKPLQAPVAGADTPEIREDNP
jgi:hypothetical protein